MNSMNTQSPSNNKIAVWKNVIFGLILFLLLAIILSLLNGGIKTNFKLLISSLLLFFLTLILFIGIFSQFVLPVKDYRQRFKIFIRLFSYFLGRHGPAIFIENGVLRERKGTRLKNGPGVIILDTASAAVLRTPVKFLGAVGPGIKFLNSQESIAGTIDLHIQSHKIGPRENENPFLEKQPNESDAAFAARQNRRHETQALTRDGIEVCSDITVEFKLDSPHGTGNSEFGYNPRAVERAIIGLSVDIRKSDNNPERIANWKWLPSSLAVDLWRDYLAKITLDDLFPLSTDKPQQLNLILNQITQRLTRQNYQLLDNFGHLLNQYEFSKEYDLLKSRGIKVISVRISDFKFPRPIEDQIYERWQTTWLEYAQIERNIIRQKQAVQNIAAKNQAVMDYAYGTARQLGAISSEKDLSQNEILALLMKGNLDLIRLDASLATNLHQEYSDISQLIDWVNR